jgi:ABC-type branched-subunit amino acid transport system ATPase component
MENGKIPIIEASGIYKSFGGLHLFRGIGMTFYQGSITALIGPNGCGKSTFFNVITGFMAPDKGEVKFKGKHISKLKPYQISGLGIRRTFQQVRVFQDLTARQNMLLAARTRQDEEKISHFLEMVHLTEYADQPCADLTYGQRKLLEFSRALLSNPDVILLDEPFSGIDHETEKVMSNRIVDMNRNGTTFIIVDHEMRSILDISDRIIVMNDGAVLTSGTSREVLDNQEVIDVYFGK